jgi:LuxR family maltose regulon positive regulatory protein
MSSLMIIQTQLLATKFYVPTSPGMLIRRPCLSALLDESLKYPLTLVSAPAGFGKTTLLSTWAQALPATQAQVAWLSLDEEENDPQLFWTYVLSALDQQQPERFTPLFKALQSAQAPSLHAILTSLINLALESSEHLVLILDDYHVITEQQVHTTLSYLVEHLSPHLHIILATRADPPLPLSLLRTRGHLLEIRTEQLRCTTEETKAFFQQVMALQLPDQTIQEVRSRTEGWLVGLQLLALSLPEQVDPLTLLEQVSGEHRYILDYLTEVVLQKQPPEVQMFLLCTSILERLSTSLCDAVMEQMGSQQMLQHLEQSNLFVVSLDSKRQWYRYHALFAQALSFQLEQTYADLVPMLHARASRWYAQHHQTTAAILHAFQAKEWQWAADLIEEAYPPLVSFAWGANKYAFAQLQQWIEQLPAEILVCRPHLCLACVHLLWAITPYPLLFRWLDLAETALRASLKEQMPEEVSQGSLLPQEQQELRDQLGKVLTLRTLLQGFQKDGQAVLVLGEQALAHLSPENAAFRTIAAVGKSRAYYASYLNDAVTAIENGYQAVLLAQQARQPVVALSIVSLNSIYLIGAGRLHEAEQLIQRTLLQEIPSGGPRLPEEGWITFCQAEILRERNQLARAQTLATEAISLCEQSVALVSLPFLYWAYAIRIRISLSCSDLDAACVFLQQAEQVGQLMNQQVSLHQHSYFITVDQVRLWLACGKLDRATRWAEQLDVIQQHLTPFPRERQEVARARVLLAQDQPTAALQRLEPVLQRATAGQRWGHVLEIRLLQALAYQRLDEEAQALAALSEAVRLGEPEGYIRTFVDEGTPMRALLSRLRKRCAKHGSTPYLDTLLTIFKQESKAQHLAEEGTKAQPLPEPLSERELEVLQLLAQGQSNHEIAHELVIALDTVKHHVGHILSKLGVTNRVHAVKQARGFGLLDEEF